MAPLHCLRPPGDHHGGAGPHAPRLLFGGGWNVEAWILGAGFEIPNNPFTSFAGSCSLLNPQP